MTKIAFIGLGTMGLPMAHNLIRGGHTVTGYDLNPDATARHIANGGQVAPTAAEAVRDAEFVFTMVPNAQHVRAALFDEEGIMEGISDSALYIDMSTIHPFETDAIRTAVQSRRVSMVDAPVGRSSQHAIDGNLLIMVGGEAAEIERARPVLELLGDTIVDCGGPGMGARMKIINNFMSIALGALTAEALTLSEAIGLERDLAIDVMSGTAAGQGHMQTSLPNKAFKGDLSPGFMVDLAHKDIGLALDLAAAKNVPVPLGAAAREMYSIARGQNRGRQDWTAIYTMLHEMAGLNE